MNWIIWVQENIALVALVAVAMIVLILKYIQEQRTIQKINSINVPPHHENEFSTQAPFYSTISKETGTKNSSISEQLESTSIKLNALNKEMEEKLKRDYAMLHREQVTNQETIKIIERYGKELATLYDLHKQRQNKIESILGTMVYLLPKEQEEHVNKGGRPRKD